MQPILILIERSLARVPGWLSRHIGTSLATTLIFVSTTSALSLIDAFH